ncbi:MAG: AsmA-like C-terminal region-containing protein [Nitrospirota bacterium]|nr:AsmA-like C-terminal region-containing protein [Nitrospirota bacterium]MDX2420874.1 AsmA-like C-terminal region-containing protein [Nitrospirota bacterium]
MRFSVKKTLLWGGLGFLVLSVLLIILPWFLNPAYLQALVLQHIQETFGSHVRVGRTSFALFPSPHFLVSDIVVKERLDSHAVFRAESMSLKLGVGQLLQKKLVVREFFLDHPEIEVRRDKSGVWRFLGHSTDDSSLSFLGSFLVLGKLEVMNGKIIVIDESPSDSVRGVVLENVAFLSETSYENVGVLSRLTLSGNLRQVHDTASFRLSGTLEATSNEPLSSLESGTIFFEQMTLAGHMETDNFAVNQLAEYVPYGDILSKFSGAMKAESQFKWVKKEMTSHLQFSNIAFSNSAITLGGNASIEGLADGHHMTAVSLRSSNLDLGMIRQAFPTTWLPDPVVDLWEKGEWGGELEVLEARVTGSTLADVGTSVTGTFRVNNGFLNLPEWPQTDHVRGTVVVEPDRIQVSEAHGVYDGIPVDVNQGVFLLKESRPWGDVEIQGRVPAKKVWDFVSHLGEPSSDFNGLQAWNVSQGDGMLRLRFAGVLFDEQGMTFQHGDYQPTNVVLSIPGLPHSLSRAHGKIEFSPDSTILDGIQGDVGTYPLTMNGTIIHQDILRLEPLNVTAGFDGQDIFAHSDQRKSEFGLQITGPLHASVAMRGPLSRLNLKGKIDGDNARFSIPAILEKAAGQAGALEFEGQVHSGGTIRFERIELAMLPLRLRGQGIVRFRPTWRWEGRLDSGPISIGLLPEKIQIFGNAIQSGILDVQLGGNGLGRDWTKWVAKGWVALTDGVVSIPGRQESIDNLFVRLRLDKDLLDLKRMEFRIKDSEAVVTGFMKHWNTNPQVSVMWDAPRFDIDLLIPKEERSVLRDGVEWIANHGRLEGSILIKNPIYKAFTGKNLSAELNIHDNLVSVDKIQAMVEKNGSVKGRVFVHLPPGKPAAMRASFKADNLPFEKTLRVLGDEHRFVSGNMNIRGKVQGHGRHARGVVPTLEGGIQLSLRNGYVRKGTVLPKILRILNLPHVLRGKVDFEKTGFPFETVTTTLNIEEGKFSTKDFLLRSPIMNVTAAGTYDLGRDHLDGVAAVSPFGAYSDALETIPLFGKIFSGDRAGITTAMFSMIGPLADPQIFYMPNESLKKGLTGLAQLAFDVLKNIVLMPVDALSGSSHNSATPLPNSTSPRPRGPVGLEEEQAQTTR